MPELLLNISLRPTSYRKDFHLKRKESDNFTYKNFPSKYPDPNIRSTYKSVTMGNKDRFFKSGMGTRSN